MFLNVMEDDTDGNFFFNALEEIDSNLDVINKVDVGDYTFFFEDPSHPYSFSN